MDIKKILIDYLSKNIKNAFAKIEDEIVNSAEEIRIRIDLPLYLTAKKKEFFISENGIADDIKKAYKPTAFDITNTFQLMSNYSAYAYNEEIKKGYITLPYGFRVGISGKFVVENDCIKSIKNISSLNIRISKEIKECSKKIINYIYNGNTVKHTLIISPPNGGKTTLLRDIIRKLSNSGINVSVIDERSEIAGCYKGISQNDLGNRADVFDCCPKAQGMLIALRSMAPDVIAVDEIGKEEDIIAIDNIINCGVKIIATVHAESVEDLKKKNTLNKLLQKNIFERFILLSNFKKPGTVKNVYDINFKEMIR